MFGFPLWGKLRKQLLLERSGRRVKLYVVTVLTEWLVSFLVLAVWLFNDRPFSALGLSLPMNIRFAIVSAIVLTACLLLIGQWIHIVRMNGVFPDSLKAQIRGFGGILPETPRERRLFVLLSLTAGICEEFLYRGFVIWYFSQSIHTIVAGLLSAFVFAIAHGYQGPTSIWKTGVFGAALAALYLISGSLIGPMLLHAVNNLSSGFAASEVLKHSTAAEDA